jgi:hypothetical protein
MTTKTEICNLALARIREMSIGDVDTDNTPQAVQCRLFYDLAVQDILTKNAWQFTKKTVALAERSTSPVGWGYEYDYPNDCLQVRRIVHPAAEPTGTPALGSTGESVPGLNLPPIPFEVASSTDVLDESRAIFCNIEDARCEYTYNLTNLQHWPFPFIELLAWRLAVDLSLALGGDSGKQFRQEAANGYMMQLDAAMAFDGNEYERGQQRLPQSISARWGVHPAQWPYTRVG